MTCQTLFRRWSIFLAEETSFYARRRTSVPVSSMNFFRVVSQASNFPSRHFLSSESGQSSTSADLHSLYLEQINEIQAEREAVFGPSDPASESHDISHVAKAYSTEEQCTTQSKQSTKESSARLPPDWDSEQAYAEREALFQFTAQEKSAWTNHSSISKQSSRMMQMELIKEVIAQEERLQLANTNNHDTQPSSQLFSHLNPKGDEISMVDVGHKTTTRRIAKARSVVFFPQEVMSALERRGKDMIGPKGPIFETARIAGMMGAK